MCTPDEKSINDIPDFVTMDVAKSTRRKKTDVKDVVDTLLGSPSLMKQIPLTILKHQEVLKNFFIFSNRQFEIDWSQSMRNSTDAVVFSQNPILGKRRDYEAHNVLNPASSSLKARGKNEETKGNALENADHGDVYLGNDPDRLDVELAEQKVPRKATIN